MERIRAREYLRVSKDKSKRERSPEEQHGDLAPVAADRGWTLGPAYRDIGSASRYATKVREDFGRLIVDLQRDASDAEILLLWEGSRGSREMQDWVTLLDLLEGRHVKVYIHTNERVFDPANPYDRDELIRLGASSELSSRETSMRGKRAHAALARKGNPSGRIPFGYRRLYDPVTRQLVAQEIEPTEAAIVRELFDRLHKGHSLRSIAADFETRGVRTRSGLVFSPQHLRSLALNPSYAGERIHDPERSRASKTTLSAKAQTYDANWPAIVDRAVFRAVERRLASPGRVTTRGGGAVHIFSMIIRCDVCGAPLTARAADRDHPHQQFQCQRNSCVRIDYDELTRYVEDVIIEYLSRTDNRAWLVNEDSPELIALRTTIADIQSEHDKLKWRVADGTISVDLAATAEPGILRRLHEAEERERELSTPAVIAGIIQPGKDARRRWNEAPVSAKREVARFLLTPEFLGEVRVTRSKTRGHRCPVEDRVIWKHTPDAV